MVTFQTLRQFYLDFFVWVLVLHNLQSFGIVELPCEVGVKWFRQYTVLVAHLLGAHGLDYPVVPPSIIREPYLRTITNGSIFLLILLLFSC